jgi:hypothetical protein
MYEDHTRWSCRTGVGPGANCSAPEPPSAKPTTWVGYFSYPDGNRWVIQEIPHKGWQAPNRQANASKRRQINPFRGSS